MPAYIRFLPLAQSVGMRETIDSLARTPLSQVVIGVVILSILRVGVFPILQGTPVHLRMTPLYAVCKLVNEGLDALIYAAVFVFMIVRPFAVQAFLIPSGSMWPTLYVNDYIVANKAIYRFTEPKTGDIVVFRPPVDATTPDQRDANGEVKVDFIKRLIGHPGDIIELRKGKLYRNGQPVEEPYIHYSTCTEQTGQECQSFRDLSPQEKQDTVTLASFKLVKYNGQTIPLNYTDKDANSPAPAKDSFTSQDPYFVAPRLQIADPDLQKQLMQQPPQPVPPGYFLMMGDNRNQSFDGRGWGLVPRASIIGRAEFIWMPMSRWRVTR